MTRACFVFHYHFRYDWTKTKDKKKQKQRQASLFPRTIDIWMEPAAKDRVLSHSVETFKTGLIVEIIANDFIIIEIMLCLFNFMFQWGAVVVVIVCSAWFTYRLGRLKPKASKSKGLLAKVYNIVDTVIGLS